MVVLCFIALNTEHVTADGADHILPSIHPVPLCHREAARVHLTQEDGYSPYQILAAHNMARVLDCEPERRLGCSFSRLFRGSGQSISLCLVCIYPVVLPSFDMLNFILTLL